MHLLCPLMLCASEEKSLTLGNCCPPEGEDTKVRRTTLGCTMSFGERLISVRRRARS